jgi:hypothetical protein
MKEHGRTKEELLQFFVSYAICAVPKEETRRALSDWAAKRWTDTRNLQETEDNVDAEHYTMHVCLIS